MQTTIKADLNKVRFQKDVFNQMGCNSIYVPRDDYIVLSIFVDHLFTMQI